MRLHPSSQFPFASLGDCGEVVTGSTPSKSNAKFWHGKIPFVTPAQLGCQQPIRLASEYVTSEGAERGRLLPEGAVLVCCIGSLGKTGVAGVPLITNQQINAIVFDPARVNARYGYHAARSLTPLLEHFAPSTTIKIVKKSAFADFEIPLPPLAEQKRLARILDAAETLRAMRRESLAQLDTLIQCTFVDMFGDPVTNPMGWEKSVLETFCRPRQWPTIKMADLLDAGYPVFGANGQIGFYSEYTHAKSTVLITCRGATCGTINVCGPMSYVTGNAMALDSLDEQRMTLRYMEHALEATDFTATITGVAQPQITRQSLKQLSVPAPPLELQHRFACVVESVEQQKATQRAHLAELDDLFASLQSRAFRGDL